MGFPRGHLIGSIRDRVSTAVETRPELSLVTIDETVSTEVPSGGSATDVVHSPPAGFIDNLVALGLDTGIPSAAAASGTHSLSVVAAPAPAPSWTIAIVRGEANFDTDLSFIWSHWVNAVASEPSDEAATLAALNSLLILGDRELRLRWTNNTDVALSTNRFYNAILQRRRIAE